MGIQSTKIELNDIDTSKVSDSSEGARTGQYVQIAEEYFDRELRAYDNGDGTVTVVEIQEDGTEVPMLVAPYEALSDEMRAAITNGEASTSVEEKKSDLSKMTTEELEQLIKDLENTDFDPKDPAQREEYYQLLLSYYLELDRRCYDPDGNDLEDAEKHEQLKPIIDALRAYYDPANRSALADATMEAITAFGDLAPNAKIDDVALSQYTDKQLQETLDEAKKVGDNEAAKKIIAIIEAEQARRESVNHVDYPDGSFTETYDGDTYRFEPTSDSRLVIVPNEGVLEPVPVGEPSRTDYDDGSYTMTQQMRDGSVVIDRYNDKGNLTNKRTMNIDGTQKVEEYYEDGQIYSVRRLNPEGNQVNGPFSGKFGDYDATYEYSDDGSYDVSYTDRAGNQITRHFEEKEATTYVGTVKPAYSQTGLEVVDATGQTVQDPSWEITTPWEND